MCEADEVGKECLFKVIVCMGWNKFFLFYPLLDANIFYRLKFGKLSTVSS